MNKYKVILPIDVDGEIYQHGAIVELKPETAMLYRHALQAVVEKEETADGRNS
ncbi:MAG TPA: hypothetical protein VHZ25_17770 [Acidobacteriaceae bacterium]|jgi:hypothetical protein|nr:hypothetical protein [Acidobacteriaceae bacterium]